MNYICMNTHTEHFAGGMNDSNRVNIMNRDLKIMSDLYSDFITIKDKKNAMNGKNILLKSMK